MDKKREAPVVNVDVILFDPQKAYVRVVGYIFGGYPSHQEGKKGERQQHRDI